MNVKNLKTSQPGVLPVELKKSERVFNIIILVLVAVVTLGGLSLLLDILDVRSGSFSNNRHGKILLNINRVPEIILAPDADESLPLNQNCRFWDCVNLYRCGQSGRDYLTIFVYPLQYYVDATIGQLAFPLTREYYQILEAVIQSPFYTSNPNEACIFLPSLDLLNENLIKTSLVNRALASLSHWDDGSNHVIVNMLPGIFPALNNSFDVNTDRAIVFGGGFDTWSYRTGFDVALPVWSPVLQYFDWTQLRRDFKRRYLLIIGQLNIIPQQQRILKTIAQENPREVLLLMHCNETFSSDLEHNLRCSGENRSDHKHRYPRILEKGTFCLLGRSLRLGQPDLLEIMAYGCIPIIAVENYVLPFEDVLDWTLFSFHIRESEMHVLLQRLRDVSDMKIYEMQQQLRWVFDRYFKDLRTITLTAFQILEGRIFPHRSHSMKQWNTIDTYYRSTSNPLFMPLISPKSQGFTAVILTYDRVESLYTLIDKLAMVSSLQSILVIWNNQRKAPPHLSAFPATLKPIKVIQTRANKLSNRFFPYAEIETEAILTIDDDIVMLTADELDFGFEVWREFPDRIVGFPSRIHVWDNTTMRWYYESEWTNQISMVLTGAAFHHKFWSHMYTYAMPGDIKEWVDEHMNCEDIAMNFLVANVTNKPPIKVTPRKKFKCPECINTEMLSADLNHMRERSACIDRFATIYGRMSLRSVEFRADPVLFKDNFPEKLKRFNDVGSL